MTDNRPSWDEYFLNIARAVAARADCSRRQVGAILVNEFKRHRGSGYNGGPSKGLSCLKGECPRGNSDVLPGSSYDTGSGVCVAIHAEQNLIMDTTPEERFGGTVYITDKPCDGCFRMITGSGVTRVVWPGGSRTKFGDSWFDGDHWSYYADLGETNA